MKPRPTDAQTDYAQRRKRIADLLSQIHSQLDHHAGEAAKDPTNWGFSGDLGHVEELLGRVTAFLGGA